VRGYVVRAAAVHRRVEQVDRRWRRVLVRVHDHETVAAPGGQHVEQVADQVTLRGVERGHPASGLHVVADHVLQQHGLAGAGRAADVDVVAAVRQRDADPDAGAGVGYADHLSAQPVPDRLSACADEHPPSGPLWCAMSVQSASGPNRPSAPERTTSTQPSTMDMKTALIWEESPGQSLDHGCAARDSNPEPAD